MSIYSIFLKVFKVTKVHVSTLGLCILSACSSGPKVTDYPTTSIPSEEVASLKQRLERDRAQQTDVLAPQAFTQAEAALAESQESLAQNDAPKDVLKDLAKSRAWLENAEQSAARIRGQSPEILEVRNQNLQAEAPALAPEEWEKADQEFIKLTNENEKSGEAGLDSEDRRRVLELYIQSHKSALKAKYLARSLELVEVAKTDGAEKMIPNILADAQKKIADAEGVIQSSRTDEVKITQTAQQAQQAAQRAVDMLQKAKQMKGQSPEAIALALDQQESKNSKTTDQLSSTQQELKIAEDAVTGHQAMSRKVEHRQKIDQLQAEFEPQEAEVLQTAQDVIIRLKGANFTSGQSAIPSKNYPLLAKVKGVIQKFPDSQVIIEGHTDSTGNQNLNQALSQGRAESVRLLLLSGEGIDKERIRAIGLGQERPISSNTTADARAMNRRVDIIIKNVTP